MRLIQYSTSWFMQNNSPQEWLEPGRGGGKNISKKTVVKIIISGVTVATIFEADVNEILSSTITLNVIWGGLAVGQAEPQERAQNLPETWAECRAAAHHCLQSFNMSKHSRFSTSANPASASLLFLNECHVWERYIINIALNYFSISCSSMFLCVCGNRSRACFLSCVVVLLALERWVW